MIISSVMCVVSLESALPTCDHNFACISVLFFARVLSGGSENPGLLNLVFFQNWVLVHVCLCVFVQISLLIYLGHVPHNS